MKSKLYSLSGSDFKLPSHLDDWGKVSSVQAHSLPLVEWPDGSWCFHANAFLQNHLNQGLSKNINGGTLATYAAQLTHLLRFCYDRGIQLQELSNSDFTRFVHSLIEEKDDRDPTLFCRDANTVIAISRLALKFLSHVGRTFHNPGFVGPEGQIAIIVEWVKAPEERNRNNGRGTEIEVWTHGAIPKPSPQKKRSPISSTAVAAITAAVKGISKTSFLRVRRYALLLLLEVTGARRSEIAMLTVQDVRDAYEMDDPMLRLRTIKRRGDRVAYRMLPITRGDAKHLIDYIKFHRSPVVKATCGEANDSGILLISQTTGRGLAPNTITQEIYHLRIIAGIEEKACAHMFRHRFVTKTLVALIEHCNVEDKESFRTALKGRYDLLDRLRQYTGHSSMQSLDRYIDLAFAEISKFPTHDDQVRAARSVEVALRKLEEILNICETDLLTAGFQLRAVAEGLMNDLRPNGKSKG